jgi:hypothetical protein
MPLDIFPELIKVVKEDLKSTFSTMATQSNSGRRKVLEMPGHYWTIETETIPLAMDEARALHGWLLAQKGQFGKFSYLPYLTRTPRGVATGTPRLNGTIARGTHTCEIDGVTPNMPALLKQGDVFRFENHNKVYMCTEDVSSNASGQCTLNFVPSLVHNNVPNNTLILWRNVRFSMSLQGNETTLSLEKGVPYISIPLSFVEDY